MAHFDSEIKCKVIDVKDSEVHNEDIPHWNRLSIDHDNEDFNELQKSGHM